MKIALDVDDMLAAFTPHAHAFHNIPMDEKVDYWCERTMDERLGQYWFSKHIAHVHEFWKTLPVLSNPKDINFEVNCYISSFPEEMFDLRQEWLRKNGFPEAPLYATSQKLLKCKELGITHLVDDRPQTIKQFEGSDTKAIHFINHYAGFEPVGPYVVTNLNQVINLL